MALLRICRDEDVPILSYHQKRDIKKTIKHIAYNFYYNKHPNTYKRSLEAVEDKIINDMCIERGLYYQTLELFNSLKVPNDLLLLIYKYTFKYISIQRDEKLKINKLLLLHKI
jgi:hypothetical protein